MALDGKKKNGDGIQNRRPPSKNEPWQLFFISIVVLGIITVILIIVSIGVLTGLMK